MLASEYRLLWTVKKQTLEDMLPQPVCPECSGTQTIQYDDIHFRPCQECCDHESHGWWHLTDVYAGYDANLDNSCCKFCGQLKRELKP